MIKSLSIIFPIYNESKRLKYCFEDINKFNSILSIKNIEYIFVDDGSKDDSCNLINSFIKKKKKIKNKIIYKIIKIKKKQR